MPVVRGAARWFWWIAGLSLVNIAMSQSGTNVNFVIGLGITVLADAIFAANKIVGFAIDAVVIGFFVVIGFKAQQARLWAFTLGMVVYALDAMIYLYAQDWMPVAFHGLALYFMFKGVRVLQQVFKAVGQ